MPTYARHTPLPSLSRPNWPTAFLSQDIEISSLLRRPLSLFVKRSLIFSRVHAGESEQNPKLNHVVALGIDFVRLCLCKIMRYIQQQMCCLFSWRVWDARKFGGSVGMCLDGAKNHRWPLVNVDRLPCMTLHRRRKVEQVEKHLQANF